MNMLKLAYRLERISRWDEAWCIRFSRLGGMALVNPTFRLISYLGDGVIWYALMLGLLVSEGSRAVPAVIHMVVVGLCCSILYKWLKGKTSRPRPYRHNPEVNCGVAPLDQFSFPSGHTLHAVAFSVVAVCYYPPLGYVLWPFTGLVSASRMVLGLHYPSDVLAGALIGATLAAVSFSL
ncbi:MAG: phosphatase PAP2 family protein [Burkholderiales bacterium]